MKQSEDRTIEEWHQILPEAVRDIALEECRKQGIDMYSVRPSLKQAIDTFTWSKTSLGFGFWEAISLLALEFKLHAPDYSDFRSACLKELHSVQGPVEESHEKSALETQEGGSHYKDMKIKVVEYIDIDINDIDYLSGNVIKYASRHRHKNGAEDIRKAIHYCQIILKLQYAEDTGVDDE